MGTTANELAGAWQEDKPWQPGSSIKFDPGCNRRFPAIQYSDMLQMWH